MIQGQKPSPSRLERFRRVIRDRKTVAFLASLSSTPKGVGEVIRAMREDGIEADADDLKDIVRGLSKFTDVVFTAAGQISYKPTGAEKEILEYAFQGMCS